MPYISLNQAADRWSISTRTLRRRIADGHLPAMRAGARAIRVAVEDVDRLFQPVGVAR